MCRSPHHGSKTRQWGGEGGISVERGEVVGSYEPPLGHKIGKMIENTVKSWQIPINYSSKWSKFDEKIGLWGLYAEEYLFFFVPSVQPPLFPFLLPDDPSFLYL